MKMASLITLEALETAVEFALEEYVAAADDAYLAYLANDGTYPEAQAEAEKAERRYKALFNEAYPTSSN